MLVQKANQWVKRINTRLIYVKSPLSLKLLKQLEYDHGNVTGEKLSTFYLFQSISVAIQRDNVTSAMHRNLNVLRDCSR